MTRPRSGASALVALLLAALGHGRGAFGQQRGEPEEAAARARRLFFEARSLMAESDFARACPQLAESYALVPGEGTEFNLAECYEKSGRLALAWRHYSHVADALKSTNDRQRWATAQGRAGAIEPRVGRLRAVIAHAPPGLVLRLDGEPIADHAAAAVVVDPGEHRLEASAPGYAGWSRRVAVDAGTTIDVVVDLPAPGAASRDAHEPVPVRGSLGAAGAALTAVGAAGLVAGAICGGLVLAKKATADDLCPDVACTSQAGVDASAQAHRLALATDVLLPIGAAAGVAGTAMLILAARRSTQGTAGAAWIVAPTPNGAFAAFAWHF